MASAEEFLRALDSIEAEIRHSPDVVFVEMSLTCEEQDACEVSDYVSRDGRYYILMTETWIDVHWVSMCLDIGGPMFPFVWSPERSEVHGSFPSDFVKDLGVGSLRIWYYVDARRNPIPKKWLKDFPLDENDPYDDEDGRATMLHQADLERACNLMRSMKTAWSMAPESVLREFGDLSMLLSMNPEDPDYAEIDIELWWPVALLTVAIRKSDVALSAKVEPYVPWHSIFDDLPAGGNHQTRLDEFKPTTWTVSLSVPGLLAATSYAVRAFRRAAEKAVVPIPERMDLRIKVNAETKVVEIDGIPYPLSGREDKQTKMVEFINALIDAKGGPVAAADFNLRTRDIESQRTEIKSLIGTDTKSGSGHRIPLEKLLKNSWLS
jgi:hypothetical protein